VEFAGNGFVADSRLYQDQGSAAFLRQLHGIPETAPLSRN